MREIRIEEEIKDMSLDEMINKLDWEMMELGHRVIVETEAIKKLQEKVDMLEVLCNKIIRSLVGIIIAIIELMKWCIIRCNEVYLLEIIRLVEVLTEIDDIPDIPLLNIMCERNEKYRYISEVIEIEVVDTVVDVKIEGIDTTVNYNVKIYWGYDRRNEMVGHGWVKVEVKDKYNSYMVTVEVTEDEREGNVSRWGVVKVKIDGDGTTEEEFCIDDEDKVLDILEILPYPPDP